MLLCLRQLLHRFLSIMSLPRVDFRTGLSSSTTSYITVAVLPPLLPPLAVPLPPLPSLSPLCDCCFEGERPGRGSISGIFEFNKDKVVIFFLTGLVFFLTGLLVFVSAKRDGPRWHMLLTCFSNCLSASCCCRLSTVSLFKRCACPECACPRSALCFFRSSIFTRSLLVDFRRMLFASAALQAFPSFSGSVGSGFPALICCTSWLTCCIFAGVNATEMESPLDAVTVMSGGGVLGRGSGIWSLNLSKTTWGLIGKSPLFCHACWMFFSVAAFFLATWIHWIKSHLSIL